MKLGIVAIACDLLRTPALRLNQQIAAAPKPNHVGFFFCQPNMCNGRICIAFDKDCSSPLAVNCDHVSHNASNRAATVVTAFWDVRGDRDFDVWREWIKKTMILNMTLLAFLPPPLDAEILEARSALGMQEETCIISMPSTVPLPYGYLETDVKHMLKRVQHEYKSKYHGWNWKSPEMTNSKYVLLIMGKMEILNAAAALDIFKTQSFVWVDAGLSRHERMGSIAWPASSQLSQFDQSKLYVSSWGGYKSMKEEIIEFCANPQGQFYMNRNHLSAGVIVAGRIAIRDILPIWRQTLKNMVKYTLWNNEQVVFELLKCFYPNSIGILDARHVLYHELSAGFGALPFEIDRALDVALADGPKLASFWANMTPALDEAFALDRKNLDLLTNMNHYMTYSFIHIPKNAGSTIEEAGKMHGLQWGKYAKYPQMSSVPCSAHHVPPRYLQAFKPYNGTHTFCVKRHPFERALSSYKDMVSLIQRGIDPSGFTPPWVGIPSDSKRQPCAVHNLNQYVANVMGMYVHGHRYVNDCHFLPQSEYIWHDDGTRACEFVLDFNNLDKDFSAFLLKQVGAQQQHNLNHMNAGICQNLTTADFDKSTKELLQAAYAKDFKELGFSA